MSRLGYKRSSKRCKEKWENINKYFKKVKESNKKRPEDSKTCPYYHQLEALYSRKIFGGGSNNAGGGTSAAGDGAEQWQHQQQQQQQEQEREALQAPQKSHDKMLQASNAGLARSLFEEGNGGGGEATKMPEDIVKELMEAGSTATPQQQQQQWQQHFYDKMEEAAAAGDSENTEEEGEDVEEDDEDDEELEEQRKMDYKIEFQRPNPAGGTSNSNTGGGNGAPSFMAMVQ